MKKLIILLFALSISGLLYAQSSNYAVPVPEGYVHHQNDGGAAYSITNGILMVHSWDFNGGSGLQRYSMFPTTSPGTDTPVAPYSGINIGNAGEMVYGDPTKFYSIDMTGDAWLIDVLAGTESSLGVVGGDWSGCNILGMALDYATGTYYICCDDNNLFTINMATLNATLVGNFINATGFMIGITFDGSGNLWGHELALDQIFSIDKLTGFATPVGPTGFDANFAQGMGYDPDADMVVLTAFNNTTFQAEYRSVNTATGNTTFLGKIGAPGILTEYASCCIAGQAMPPTIPISNWAILIGILLISTIVIFQFRRRMA